MSSLNTAMSARTRILASAGTGKTFRLTSHFLALLFAGADPQRILATTFTRKAAGEILERVLTRLATAARDGDALEALGTQIGEPTLDAARCVDQLQQLARHLNRFQVRTLDAFFVRVVTLFGLDLGLPPTWSIADPFEADEIRAEAVGRLLASSQPKAMTELLRGLDAQPAGRAVHASLIALLGAGRAAFLDSQPRAWDWLEVPPGPAPEELAQTARALDAYPLPRTQKGTPIKHWANAIAGIRGCCASERFEALLDNGIMKKIMAGEITFARREIDETLRAILEPLFGQLAHQQLSRLAARNRSMHALLDQLDKHYRQLLCERGKLRFEDVPALIDPRDGESPIAVDDLWFRLDGQIDHLLFDELQDTSACQWRVLEPLASEIVSQADPHRSFFCVGDAKQCIYTWRQAEPRLLQELERLLPGLEPAETLSLSYRSSPVILDTINRVFGQLGEQSIFTQGPLADLRPYAEEWREGFDPHRAHHRTRPGSALLIAPREVENGDDQATHPEIELTAERVDALLERHPRARVGILFRTNKPIPTMMHCLARHGRNASGEGGNPLTDSVATLHLLALLILADHPGHTRAALAVATSAFGRLFEWPAESWQDRTEAARVARAVRRRLAGEGYGAFFASLAKAVGQGYGAWDARRFAQLVDLAESWNDVGAPRPARFVDHVLSTRVEDPTASNIQCMTVHAAKGLEFDAVFLPELGGALSREPAELLTHRPDPARLIEAICIKPAARVAALSTDLDMLYTNAKGRLLAEALSLLYVGMTRARYGLEMIVPSPASGSASRSGKASAAVLLAETLGAGEPDTGGILWQHPESDEDSPWACDQQVTTPAVAAPPLPRGLGLREAATPRSVVMRSPSDRESFGSGPSGSGIADLLRAPGRHALRLGTLVHRLFEEIEWLEDLHASDATLDNLLAPQEADRTIRRQALEIFRRALTHSEVAALLSRASHPGEREVLRERPFCTELPEPDGTTVLWNGTIDRMVIQRLNGKPVGVDVIDFKSDRIDHQAVATRSAVYRSQMAVYARVVAAQTQLAATAIRTHLVFLVPGRVYTS